MAFVVRPSPVFIEVAQKVAVWNGTWSGSDNGGFAWTAGVFGHWYQTRGKAWGLRSLCHAAFITPESEPWRAGAVGAIKRNGQLIGTFRTDVKARLGAMWNYSPSSLQDHASNSPHFQFAVWEQQYLAVEAHKVAGSGLLDSADRAAFEVEAHWLLSQAVRWVNERTDGGWRFVPYSTALGPSKSTIDSPPTWGEQMAQFMVDRPSSSVGSWQVFGNNVANTYANFEIDRSAGAYYPSYLWAALAAARERGVSGAVQAWETVNSQITDLDGWLDGFAFDPRWGLTPRNL
jgi:hypothetical protein